MTSGLVKRDPRSSKEPMAKVLVLLAAKETTEEAPVAPEPEEAQAPLLAEPAEVRDDQVAIPAAPDRSGERQVEVPPFGRNLLLVLQQVLGLALAERSILLLRSLLHLLAGDVALATHEEGDELEVRRGQGLVRNILGDVLHKLPALLRHVAEESGSGRAGEATFDCCLESCRSPSRDRASPP